MASFNVAFGIGGSYGRGFIMKRISNNNWSFPLAIQEIETNVGWQLNISRSKIFYILNNKESINNFKIMENFKLGGKGFVSLPNIIGIQAQGDLKTNKNIINGGNIKNIKNNYKNEIHTNLDLSNLKGIAFGANINIGTYQLCNNINNNTYDNFNINNIFNKGINDPKFVVVNQNGKFSYIADIGSTGNTGNTGNNNDDQKMNENGNNNNNNEPNQNRNPNLNKVKSNTLMVQLREFVQLLERAIRLENEA